MLRKSPRNKDKLTDGIMKQMRRTKVGMSTGCRCRGGLCLPDSVEKRRGDESDFVDQTGTVGGDRLDRDTKNTSFISHATMSDGEPHFTCAGYSANHSQRLPYPEQPGARRGYPASSSKAHPGIAQ